MSGPQGPVEPMQRAECPIDPNLRIGHVHLRTADIDRVREFYVGILGFDLVNEARDRPGWGTTGDMLFVSAGGYHHHLAFNTWKSAAAHRNRTASRGCTTSRSISRHASSSQRRSGGSSTRASRCGS